MRRAWAEEGHVSLWDYLLRVLHLREGAAFRRIAAMRVLRRLPALAEALRDGRLCLSTLAVLGPLLTEENVGELVTRSAFLTKADVERLVVTPSRAPHRRTGCDCCRRRRRSRRRPVRLWMSRPLQRCRSQRHRHSRPRSSSPLRPRVPPSSR